MERHRFWRKSWLVLWLLVEISQAQQEEKELEVTCGASKIEIRLDKAYLRKSNIDIRSSQDLHLSNDTSCIPVEEESSYRFMVFPPFTGCGTRVQHDTEDYVYSNDIFYSSKKTNKRSVIFKWRCVYEDKYNVTLDFAIKPVKRTLQFVTEKGKFDVDMNVFQENNYSPQSAVTEKTPIKLNTPVWVQLELTKPFQWPKIVLSVRSCFATDQPSASTDTDNYYSIISGMCASPTDSSVKLLENGDSNLSRFKFNMFKWRTKTSYIYMHCEVHLCDKTTEKCSKQEDDICTGADRQRRSPNDVSQINEPKDGEVLTELKPTFMSKGPIIIDELDVSIGKGDIEAIQVLEFDNDFLRIYIVTSICVVLAFVGILVIIIAVVIRRRGQRSKEEMLPASSSKVPISVMH